MNFKEFHIGELIKTRVGEMDIDDSRLANFFGMSIDEVHEMYNHSDISVNILLKWSKILEYDFFRLYSQHLILFSPPAKNSAVKDAADLSLMPQFRKRLYSEELILFILEMIKTGEMTKAQVIKDYNIPKTTLFKWASKYMDKIS